MDIFDALEAILRDFEIEPTGENRDRLWSILNSLATEAYEDGQASGYN